MQSWLESKNIKGFYSVVEDDSFSQGAKNLLVMSGLGKLSPNMLLLGFKADWASDVKKSSEYFSILQVIYTLLF